MIFDWEIIQDHPRASCTSRAKVFGGWIVHVAQGNVSNTLSTTMVFVSDPKHEWEID